MGYITQEKLVIVGAAGAIGSNMVQSALTMELTPNIVMYDPFAPGLEGAAEEIYHCSFPGANVTWTTDIAEALDGAAYLVSSGGAPRKEGMTREDLLAGNCEIAARLGREIRAGAPDLKLGVIVFNPADITGLVVQAHSGLAPGRIATLAALDSTRLQAALAQYFGIPQDRVTGCRTYGGHGEMMAVFASTARVDNTPLTDLIGTPRLPAETWDALRAGVRQGGKQIIQLRGRSSFQSPAHQSVRMIKAAMDGHAYPWPAGVYVDGEGFEKIVMAMETRIGRDGVRYTIPAGTAEEMADLHASYRHLCELRDEVVDMGLLPPLDQWHTLNPNL